MRLHKGFLVFVYAVILSGTAAVAACGSGSGGSGFGTDDGGGSGDSTSSSSGGSSGSGSSSGVIGMFSDGSTNDAPLPPDPSDPQPKICTESDGGMEIVQQVDAAVYGSIECPSDKNLPNCPCSPLGATAPCWTGTRATRGVGQCKDGTTTCVMQSENGNRWGQCMGEVLPDPSADAGAAACKCFSTGQWAIANIEPCIFFTDSTMTSATGAVSTTNTMPPACPSTLMSMGDWSTDTITADCAGEFTLCFTIKAGNPMSPMPSDCVVGQACASGWVPAPNMLTSFPNLPGWQSTNAACATQFATSGGYGEMSVYGFSHDCETIGSMSNPVVFEHEPYCPIKNPPSGCVSGGSGNF
jgi:hypothetical protein